MCLRGSKKVTVSALSRQIPAPLFSDAPEVIHETKKDEKKKYSEIYGNFHNVHTYRKSKKIYGNGNVLSPY